MPKISAAEVRGLLEKQPDPNVSAMRNDTAVIKCLVDILNASVALAAVKNRTDLAVGLLDKAVKTGDLAANVSGRQVIRVTSFVASETAQTIGLVALAGMSPARASVAVTFTVADKVVKMAGIADSKTFDKCHVALASLAATAGLGGVACVGTAGLACVTGAIAIASEAFNVYGQCRLDTPEPALAAAGM